MSTRLRDSERTKLIAEFIRTGKSPAGYEITECKGSKYKVRKLKSKQEMLESKRDRLRKQLESVETELHSLDNNSDNNNDKSEAYNTSDNDEP